MVRLGESQKGLRYRPTLTDSVALQTATVDAVAAHDCCFCLCLNTSVTPTPTLSTTIACSATCYAVLLETAPALHLATELIGGPAALWKLEVALNVERLRLLHRTSVQDIYLLVSKKSETLVNIEGSMEYRSPFSTEPVRKPNDMKIVDVAPYKSAQKRLLDCRCFVCSNDGMMESPIRAVQRCGVKEVRAALAINGFDLDAFDNRSVIPC